MSCFGMGLKERFHRRGKSNASNASNTSDSANTESMAASEASPSSQKAKRLHDVAEAAKSANPGLEAEDSVDTAVSVAPAVTHEVVRPQQHEVVEEQITREIHTHEVHQKIQPIFDVEVRPARHLVPDDDGRLVEVTEEEISNVYRAREAEAEAEGKGPRQASSTTALEEEEVVPTTQRRYNLRSGSRQP
ncbi:hypothetical protein QBC39DRAFT_369060 [Podospora conica]|nr:hypothetical protein QBC39DRAFT_369060 [Schizothecium conicum]